MEYHMTGLITDIERLSGCSNYELLVTNIEKAVRIVSLIENKSISFIESELTSAIPKYFKSNAIILIIGYVVNRGHDFNILMNSLEREYNSEMVEKAVGFVTQTYHGSPINIKDVEEAIDYIDYKDQLLIINYVEK